VIVVYIVLATSLGCLLARRVTLNAHTPDWLDRVLGYASLPLIVVLCVPLSLLGRRIGGAVIDKVAGRR
jgi:hypothetical protein